MNTVSEDIENPRHHRTPGTSSYTQSILGFALEDDPKRTPALEKRKRRRGYGWAPSKKSAAAARRVSPWVSYQGFDPFLYSEVTQR